MSHTAHQYRKRSSQSPASIMTHRWEFVFEIVAHCADLGLSFIVITIYIRRPTSLYPSSGMVVSHCAQRFCVLCASTYANCARLRPCVSWHRIFSEVEHLRGFCQAGPAPDWMDGRPQFSMALGIVTCLATFNWLACRLAYPRALSRNASAVSSVNKYLIRAKCHRRWLNSCQCPRLGRISEAEI